MDQKTDGTKPDLATDVCRWIESRATAFESCRLQDPLSLSEQLAVDRMVGSAMLIGLGEMTHGSKELQLGRSRLLKFLIQERDVSLIVLETCIAGTQSLNKFVTSGAGTAIEALTATEYWSTVNKETLEFIQWLREYNLATSGRHRPVEVYGCDVQSLDNAKTTLLELLSTYAGTGELGEGECEAARAEVGSLPTDRELYGLIEALISSAPAAQGDGTVIIGAQKRLADFLQGAKTSVERIVPSLRDLRRRLPEGSDGQTAYLFDRCTRLLEQCVAFYGGDDSGARDRFMAENVMALRQHFRGRKLALAAHNLHLIRSSLTIRGEKFMSMGCLLRQELLEEVKVICSAFHHGTYLETPGERQGQQVAVEAYVPQAASWEFSLGEFGNSHGMRDFLLDLSVPDATSEDRSWKSKLEMRLGETGSQDSYEQCFVTLNIQEQFDGLLFIEQSSPITVLPEYYPNALAKWGKSEGPAATEAL